MGSAVGRALSASGARVLTTLEGRSAASAARAKDAGMQDASLAELAACDFILSIVPPAVAVQTAERLAPRSRRRRAKPSLSTATPSAPIPPRPSPERSMPPARRSSMPRSSGRRRRRSSIFPDRTPRAQPCSATRA
ncbi:hypothetical protein [Caballeronia sp. GAFFF1]|uniref:hypothetical protein n=1 Tax=Caballeronia sp. GAFFF1 TaxID=2921779 RepID=UPI00202804A1|nr:hypothetical protein [Caballeronia sp. GAFFF1]